GLFYAPDPSSLDSCCIGGTVATNASGPRNPKYGPTRDHVRGLEVVLPGGRIIRTGGHFLKGVAGYDLCSLICGSEGTLGVITEVVVRLLPRPRAVETAVLFFPSTDSATRAVVALMKAGHRPRALEMMDNVAVEAVRGKAPFRFPEGEQSLLVLELDGHDREAVFAELAEMGEKAEAELGASLVLVAKSESERRDLWESRRMMSPCLKERWAHKFAEDVAVPLDRVPELVDHVHARADEQGIASCVYGHAGDGNLHVNFLFEHEEARPAVMRAAGAVFEDTIALGGTITSEHGVGLVKRDYMSIEQTAPVLNLQRSLKAVFDPLDLMNPGKVFPPPGTQE
ncbi:MAG: FAD-binding oxidoreductase, partial [Myxococcota bacterium]